MIGVGERPSAPPETESASVYLRRRTLSRASRGYLRWAIGTFGWGTIVYVVAWAAIALISTVQTVAATPPLGLPAEVLRLAAVACAAALLALGTGTARTPPVILDCRDVVRLGLAPLPPAEALAWPLWRARAARFLLGLALGTAWSLLAPALFSVATPLAPLVAAVLLASTVDLAWVVYAARQRPGRRAGPIAGALGLLAVLLFAADLVGPVGPGRALFDAAWGGLLGPVLLAFAAFAASRATLADEYPPRFVAHSLVLGQIQALRASTRWLQTPPDPDLLHRLEVQLAGRPGALKPVRFLPLPPFAWGPTGAVLWRSGLALYRRPAARHAVLAALFALSIAVHVLAGGNSVSQVLLAVLIGRMAQQSLVTLPGDRAPTLLPPARTFGRVLPGALLVTAIGLVSMLALASLGAPLAALSAAVVALQTVFATVLLEKLSYWIGGGGVSSETAFGVGLVASLVGLLIPWPGNGLALLALTVGLSRWRWI